MQIRIPVPVDVYHGRHVMHEISHLSLFGEDRILRELSRNYVRSIRSISYTIDNTSAVLLQKLCSNFVNLNKMKFNDRIV